MPRRRHLDNIMTTPPRRNSPTYRYNTVARSDNTANVVRPTTNKIRVAKNRNLKEEKEIARRMNLTPVRPQAQIGPYREKTELDKAGGRLFAAGEQMEKDAQAREEGWAALNALFKPIMPSTYIDMYKAYKAGNVNNGWDVLAAPYLTDSWSQRNPGKALVVDLAAPFVVGKGAQLLNKGTRGLRLARAMNTSLNGVPENYSEIVPKVRTRIGDVEINNPQLIEVVPNSSIQPINDNNVALTSSTNWDWNRDIALFNGDKKKLQQLRYLHFKAKAPNSKVQYPVWHSSEVPFNTFDLSHFGATDSGFFGYGHYLTPYKKYAASYHPINRSFYVNAENPSTRVDGAEFFNRDAYIKAYINRKRDLYKNYIDNNDISKLPFNLQESIQGLPKQKQLSVINEYLQDYQARQLAKYDRYRVFFEGKDSQFHWRNLQGNMYKQEGLPSEIVIPNGAQIKSTLPITFDDKGNIIPLSLRDNFNINDIRFKYGGAIKRR